MNAVLVGGHMARGGGRSKDGPTKSVRVFEEEGEMLYWIGEVTGDSSAKILRPMIRTDLTAMYERLRPLIEKLKGMREEERRLREGSAPEAGTEEPPATPRPRRRPGGS